ncbi:DNA cytosine methyltransferase [Streptomyces sp. DT117]|uniref:DNA cytosine methyltransferase n=1 Tax=Streptomyces sp. DT117 TaxID=3393422 RepID=UPI003CFAE275
MNGRTAVELFAGPGGMTLGLHAADIHGTGIEWDPNVVATRRAAKLPTIHADVRNHGPRDFPDATVLAGGPPCQTFTVAGNGTGRDELDRVIDAVKRMGDRQTIDPREFADERTALVLEPLRWVLEDFEHSYNTIILEQVPQALPVWEAYADVLRQEGYSVATGTLATEQYGVPQTRRRAVLIAQLVGEASLPAPTHRPYRKGQPQHEGDPRLLPWVSMGDALDRPTPFTVVSNYGTGGDPKNRGRRTSSEPAFTVTGKISRNRIIDASGAELPRFTADWPWAGNDIPQQIGNACPPALAAALAHATRQPLRAAA